MLSIDVLNDHGFDVPVEALRQAAAVTLEALRPNEAFGLTIVLSNDSEVRTLNHQFRRVDAPTDVLSFPADEQPFMPASEPRYLGDILIAFPYTAAQAEREGFSLRENLMLLVVHGTLHLLGFDHDTMANRKSMWVAQERILRQLNISPALVPALEGQDDDEE
ncbi:MAG: rRNA maturation RNase YbeY [Aggregatilineales bacterium]